MDSDQTAPIGEVLSGSTLFVEEASKTFQQTLKAKTTCCDSGALRVKTWEICHEPSLDVD